MTLYYPGYFFGLLPVPRMTSTTWMISGSGTPSRGGRSFFAGLSVIRASFGWNIYHSCGDHYPVELTLISNYQLHLILFLIKGSLDLIFVLLHRGYWAWGTAEVQVSALVNWLLNTLLFCWNWKFVYIVFFGRFRWFPLHRTIKPWVMSINQWPMLGSWVGRFILLLLYFVV